MLFLLLFGLLVFFVTFVTSEVHALRSWHGAWRASAALPALVLAFIVARIVLGIAHDPTSHNLWPLEIVLWSAVGLAVLGLLWLVRRVSGVQGLGA